ncbi:MAG: hypothetical protein ACRED1_00195, partial [Limisphaerales bacterium]
MQIILAALAVLSFGLLVWQYLAAEKFPLHQRGGGPPFSPAVSILKPLKGCDATTAASLESWLNFDYPGEIQLLLGVASSE